MFGRIVEKSVQFKISSAALRRNPRIARIVDSLVRKAVQSPHEQKPEPGKTIRIWRVEAFDGVPAVRLFYDVDPWAVYLLDVETFDELEP